MNINILALGDIVGERGTGYICRPGFLSSLKKEYGVSFVVANGENSAKGNGLTPDSASALFDAGVDVITGGNHTWQKSNVYSMLDDDERLLRPANFPGAAPGHGSALFDVSGVRVLVFNLSGNAFMTEPVASPFEWADKILKEQAGKYDISVLDFHAEATSEKLAFAHHFDGRLTAVVGTHTHIQTADEQLLPKGTAYITDLGMVGAENSILGMAIEPVINRFITGRPSKFEVAEGAALYCAVLIETDDKTNKPVKIERIQIKESRR